MDGATATDGPARSARTMLTNRFSIDVTCPRCGGPVALINPGCTTGKVTKAIVACADHHRHGQWLITCHLTHTSAPVGTTAGI